MANNLLVHEILGRLDLQQPDLGIPAGRTVWKELLQDRRPVGERQLICGYCLRDHDERVPMYVYERGALRIAAHQYGDAERRHAEPESDEHKAYKARVYRVATDAGFNAVAEGTASDRKVRSDVLISGAAGPIGWEVQRAHQKASVTARRDAGARRNGITVAWHTDRMSLASRNEVAWLRTDDLPAIVIERRGYIAMGGVTQLNWLRCNDRNPAPCPVRGRGRCGHLHPEPEPDRADLDYVVRRVAEGALTRIILKGVHRDRKLWVPAADRDRCADAGLLLDTDVHRQQLARLTRPLDGTGTSDADPTCTPGRRLPADPGIPSPRPALAHTTAVILDWSARHHVAPAPGPCRVCRNSAYLLDDHGRHCHKTCAEAELSR